MITKTRFRKLWAWAITLLALPFVLVYIVMLLGSLLIKNGVEYLFYYCGPTATKEEGKTLSNPVSRWMSYIFSL